MTNNKKPTVTLSDWVALAINGIYTYHIFVSNTPDGTEAQRDFVMLFTFFGMVFAWFASLIMTDAIILKANERTSDAKFISRVFFIAQVLMFAYFAQFWLMMFRIMGTAALWARTRLTIERAKEKTGSGRAT